MCDIVCDIVWAGGEALTKAACKGADSFCGELGVMDPEGIPIIRRELLPCVLVVAGRASIREHGTPCHTVWHALGMRAGGERDVVS